MTMRNEFDGTFHSYQRAAINTAVYPGRGRFWGLVYTALKGAGEAGEFAEKVGKLMRDGNVAPSDMCHSLPNEKRDQLIREIGDELWYIAAKCTELNITLAEVARLNIEKLRDRQQRNQLHGSGDDR